MDSVIQPHQSYGWELLAQIARCGQTNALEFDENALLSEIVEVLQRYLPAQWGVVATIQNACIRSQVDWGLGDDQKRVLISHNGHWEASDGQMYQLHGEQQLLGILLLANAAPEDRIDPSFANALTAQLSFLLVSHRRALATRRSQKLRELVDANHALVGQADLRTLLTNIASSAVQCLGFDSGSFYVQRPGADELDLAVTTLTESAGATTPTSKRLLERAVQDRAVKADDVYIAVPLIDQNDVVGALLLYSAELELLHTEDLRHQIELFASRVALLIRHVDILAQQQQRGRELFVLYENSQASNSAAPLDAMLTRIVENIAMALQADTCSILLFNQSDLTKLRLTAIYVDQSHNVQSTFPSVLSVDDAATFVDLLQNDNAQLVEDLSLHHNPNPIAEMLCELGCRQAWLLPLHAKGQVVGVMALGYLQSHRVITQAENNLAHVLADQVATTIVNQQLFTADQRRVSELELLQDIGHQLNADLALDETLEAVLRNVQRLADFVGARIVLYDTRTQTLRPEIQRGLYANEQFVGNGPTEWLIRRRRALRLDTLHAERFFGISKSEQPLVLEGGAPIRSYLGLPLSMGNDVVATLELASDRSSAFSADDERLLAIVASQAAQAIVNALRYEQADEHLKSRIAQLRALQRVSSQLAITLAQEDILAFVLDQALKATNASHGLIALRSLYPLNENERQTPETLLQPHFSSDDGLSSSRRNATLTSDDCIVVETAGFDAADRAAMLQRGLDERIITAQTALQSGEPAFSEELSELEAQAVHYVAARSALAVPIWYEANVVGVVLLLSSQLQSFDYDAIEFMRALSHQAAIGIGNAQRYAELSNVSQLLQRRASILNNMLEIGQELRADRTIEDLLEQIGYSISETTNFRTVLFTLVEPDKPQYLRAVAGAGIPLNELERIAQSPFPVEFAVRYLEPRFLVSHSYFVPSEAAHEIERDLDAGLYSYQSFDEERAPGEWQRNDRLFLPLYTTEGRLLGLMIVGDPIDRCQPDRRTVEPLEIFANQAAIAIENNYLLRDAHAHAEQMTALFRVGTAATSTIELDELLDRVCHEILTYVGTPSFFFIASYLPEHDQLRIEFLMREGELVERYHKAIFPRSGLAGLVIDRNESILIPDWHNADLEYVQTAISLGEDVRSWLGVPLRSQNRVIGVLSVQDFEPNAFSSRDLQFLTALANQLAVAMENALLFYEREQRIAELDVVNRIANITNLTQDLEQVLRQVHSSLADLLDMDAFFIVIYRAESNEISMSLRVDSGVQSLDRMTRRPEAGSLVDRIIHSQQPLLFRNLEQEYIEEDLKPVVFGQANRIPASWLGVPLIIGNGEVIGVISVQSYTPNLYGEREKVFLATVASQLALEVQNIQLLAQAQEQVKQLGLLNRVSLVAAATLEKERIYHAMVEAMAQATGVDQARLVLYDRDAGIASVVAEYKPTDVADTIAIQLHDNPAVDWLDEHNSPLAANDAQNDPLFVRSYDTFRALDIQSIGLIPLLEGGKVIGCVGLDFVGRRGSFGKQSLELCQTIANQTVTAIVNARLFDEVQTKAKELQTKVKELSTLLDAARILNSLLQPGEVLAHLMDLVRRQLGVTTVALWRIDADRMMRPAAMDGIPEEIAQDMIVPVGAGLTGTVAETVMPLIVSDVDEHSGSLYPDFQREYGLISYMGIPVIYRGQAIGVLSVMTNARREFSNDEMMLLVGLADQAATALENARLFQERERQIGELRAINRISSEVGSTLDERGLLQTLYHGIAQVVDVGAALVALYDESSDTLALPIGYDRGQPVELEVRPLANGMSGWVVRHRQSLLIHTADQARRMGVAIEDDRIGAAGSEPQSFLVVPMMFGDAVLGIINVQGYDQRAFNEDDQRFVTTVANQAAIALNNARLFSETRQNAVEMTMLYEVTSNLSGTLDPHEVRRMVADAVLWLLNAQMCAVCQLDRRGNFTHLVLADQSGIRNDLEVTLREDGLTRKLLESDTPLAITDLLEIDNPNPLALQAGIRSVMGMAIGSRDDRLGVIWVGCEQSFEWSEHQQSLLSILTSQAGQALKSAQLFELEQARRRTADTLRDVARSFTSTLALGEIQTLILDQLARVVPYDSAAVLLRDNSASAFQLTNVRGLSLEKLPDNHFTIDTNAVIALMAESRRPVLVEDVSKDARFDRIILMAPNIQAWIGAPLLVDDELIGVLLVGSFTSGAYGPEESEVTFALASQASQAVQNARLFDRIRNFASELEQRVEEATRQVSQEKERLEAVHRITLELTSTLNLDDILKKALSMVSTNIGVSRGSIMLHDQRDNHLICRAVLESQGDAKTANMPISFDDQEGLSDWVMRHQQAVCIDDVLEDSRWVIEAGRADDVRSVVAVPLMTSDTTLGVIILSSPERAYFTEPQVRLLETIAREVAIAINNAQLYNYITEMASRLSDLLVQQREEASKSRAILQSVTEGVIVLDQDRQISLFNPAAEHVLDIPSDEVLNHPMDMLKSFGRNETQRQRAQIVYNGLHDGLERAKKSQGIYSLSMDLISPQQVIAMNLAPVIGPGGQRYGDVAVLRDITREIESDRAKRKFISDVSHELRTPLTSIKGYVDVLLISSVHSLNEEQIGYLNVVRTNANRLKSLIDDILDISRLEGGKIQLNFAQVNIAHVIGDVIQSLQIEAKNKQMNVIVDVPDNLPLVAADQKRLTQVIFNLYSNALKYTYEQGQVIVRAFMNQAHMMQVEVVDNGVGMSFEQRQKLFRPFYRADNPLREVAGGTGLGLSIAKALVEQHNGEMWVASELGKGSAFSFILPLQQPEPDKADEDAE